MASFNDTQYKANFGFVLVSLPNPTVNQEIQLKNYAKATQIGRPPRIDYPEYNYLEQSWTTRTSHQQRSYLYNQQSINYLTDNAPDLRVAISNTVSAFKKESDLETGLIINFIAG